MENKSASRGRVTATVVTAFLLAYGLHYFGYFLRTRFFTWINGLGMDEAPLHVVMYLGHWVFLTAMILYAWAVKDDRKYFLSAVRGNVGRNVKYGLLGAVTGFVLMGICILAAALHGDIAIQPASVVNVPLLIAGLLAVFLQSATEELESRAFLFGKMKEEGVPLPLAAAVSAFFFSYIHAANPGFGLIPLLTIFVVGVLFALSYHYFGTIWFVAAAHMAWNFTQDFIFGLPDSGKPAVISIFNMTVNGSGFFFDPTFGIEGSVMAILVNSAACVAVVLIGRRLRRQQP